MKSSRQIRVFLGVSVLVLAVLGCNFLNNGLSPAEPSSQNEAPGDTLPAASPVPAVEVLFEDDFSNKSNDWDRVTEAGGSTDYANDGYRIFVNEPLFDYWANPSEFFDEDIEVIVEATKVAGPDQNDFGVICRYRQDVEAQVTYFYAFLISSDGKAGIYKVDGNDTSFLNSSGALDIESSAIRTGNSTNTIRAQCIGSTLALYVNDVFVTSATDSAFNEGDIGLIAGTFDTPGTDILFDNIKVIRP